MKPSIYKVLVVDDNEAVRNLIVSLLSTPGHDCVSATDGKDALMKASQDGVGVDAVVTGAAMPRMDGITLTRALLKRYGSLPIMMMIEGNDPSSPASAVAAGIREFVRKPFSAVEFAIRFHKMMHDDETFRRILAEKDGIILRLNKGFERRMERSEVNESAITNIHTGQA